MLAVSATMKKSSKPTLPDPVPASSPVGAPGVDSAENSGRSIGVRSGKSPGKASPPREALGDVDSNGESHGPQSPRNGLFGVARLQKTMRQVEATSIEVLAEEAADEIERLREKLRFYSYRTTLRD